MEALLTALRMTALCHRERQRGDLRGLDRLPRRKPLDARSRHTLYNCSCVFLGFNSCVALPPAYILAVVPSTLPGIVPSVSLQSSQ